MVLKVVKVEVAAAMMVGVSGFDVTTCPSAEKASPNEGVSGIRVHEKCESHRSRICQSHPGFSEGQSSNRNECGKSKKRQVIK
jgi:hypothetical protein